MRFSTICGIFVALSLVASYAQWEKVKNIPPPFDNSYWLEMYFLPDKPNYGWVCGYDGKVLRTTDMGKTWSGTIIRGAYQLEHIHFVDEKVGFTSGIGSNGFGKIYKTTDGGVTWFDITPLRAEDLWGHWFVDKDYGIVVGGGCITSQKFFVTTNGGISWDFVTEINNFPNSGLTDVILYNRDGLGYATSSGYIWKTTNGGRSWQIFSRSGDSDWQEDLWVFGNTIIVPYSVGCGGDGGTGGVRSTNDFGRTWKQFSTGTSMFGAFLHDSLRGWVCGWNRAVYYTSNGGNTWNLLNCGIDPGVSLDDFWFINDTLGWVVGNGIYKYTSIKKVISKIQSIPDTIACEGDTITLKAVNDAKFYQWSTNSTSKEIKVTKSGRYELLSWDSDCDTIVPAVVTLTFNPKPKIKLSLEGTAYLCEGSEFALWFTTDSKYARWADGRTDTILVNKPGRYVAYVFNEFGCVDSAYVEVRLVPRPKIQSIGQTSFCEGDSVVLFLEGNFDNVLWLRESDSEIVGTGKSFVAKKSGKYFAKVFTIEGCELFSDTVSIEVRQEINAFEILLSTSKYHLYFDTVRVRELKCLELLLKNTTDETLTLNHIFIKGNTSFSTKPGDFPLVLSARGTAKVDVCYSPSKLGTERDTIIIFDRCWNQYVYLEGVGSPNEYTSQSSCNVTVYGITTQLSTKSVGVNIFPNSSNGYVYVQLSKNSGDLKFQLYNSLGRLLESSWIENKCENHIINLSEFPTGIYFLRITSSDNFNYVLPLVFEK